MMLFDVRAELYYLLILRAFHVFFKFDLEGGDFIGGDPKVENHKEHHGHHVEVETARDDDAREVRRAHDEAVVPREDLLLRLKVEQGEAAICQDQQEGDRPRFRDGQLGKVKYLRFLVVMQFELAGGWQVFKSELEVIEVVQSHVAEEVKVPRLRVCVEKGWLNILNYQVVLPVGRKT
jgi:hypothetical protein